MIPPFELSMAMLLARGALYLQDLAEESAPKASTEDVHNSDADKSAGNASSESQFGDPPPSAPENPPLRVPSVLSNPSSKSEADQISDNEAWKYIWNGINNLLFPYSDITPENAIEKGRSYYETGDYEKASVAYSIRIDAKSRDSKARRLRMEANQKVLEGLKERAETEGISSEEKDYLKKRLLQTSQQIYSDQAMYWAVEAKKEKKSLGDIKKVLEQLHDATKEQKQDVVNTVEAMGHQYLVLGSQQYQDKEDTEFVREQLSGLAHNAFYMLADFCCKDKTGEIRQLTAFYDGYRSLAQGEIDSALTKFKLSMDEGKDAPRFEEANEIVHNIETDQLRRINLYALEAWRAYIQEGEAVESNEANGWIGQGILFFELVAGKDETIQDRVAKRYGLERDLHNAVLKRIVSGKQNTIQAALEDIEKNGQARFRDRACEILAEQHTNTNDSGYVIPHLVAYSSQLNSSAEAGRVLIDDGAMLDSQYFAVSTPAAIYSLVANTTKDSSLKADAKAYMESLEQEKGLGDVMISLYRSESLEMLALDIVTFKAAGTVGTEATIRALDGLRKAGVVGRRGVLLAEAAGITAEASTFWGIGEVREGAFNDVNKVYAPEHMAKNYGADLIMIAFLKGLAPRIGTLSTTAARGLGMVKNGGLELTWAGKVFAGAGGHTGGIGGMFAASQTNHYLGLRQAASKDWKAGLAIDVYTYVKYAFAQKAISGEGVTEQHAEHAKLASLKAAMLTEGAVKNLGYTPESRTPDGDPIYADPTAQSLYLQLTMLSIRIPDFNPNKLTSLLKRGRIKEAEKYVDSFGMVLEVSGDGKAKHVDGIREMNYHEILAKEEGKAASEADTVPDVDKSARDTEADPPGGAYAAPENTVAIRHDRVHVDGMRPVEPPKDLPLKIKKLGEFIEENPNAPGVDRVTPLYNEAKRQYDALKDRGALNNPKSDTIYQLFDINRLLNQAIKIQQAARPAGGEEGDTVVMSNPDVGDTVVMHTPDVKNSDVRDAQPDSAPKSSGTRRIQDQETQHNTDTPDEAKAVVGDTVVMDAVPTVELPKPVNPDGPGKSKVRGSTGKSEKSVPKTEVDPETVKPDSELAKDIEEIESTYSGLKGKLGAEDFEWDENGYYVLEPSAERTRQLIDILRENLSDVFPELSISPDMDEATVVSRLRTFLENYRAAEKVIAGEDQTHCGYSSALVNNILLAKGFEPFMVSVHQVNFYGKNNPMTELLMRISAKLRMRPDYIKWIFDEFREDMTLTEFKDVLKDEVDSVTGDTITNVGEGADISAAYKEMKNTTSAQRDAVANLKVGGWGHAISAVRIGSKYYLIDINGEQFGKELDKLTLIPEEDAFKHGIMLKKPLEQSKQGQEIWDAFKPFHSGIAKNQRDIQRKMRAQEAHSKDTAPNSEPKATEPQPDTSRVPSSFRDPSDALLYECQDTYQSILVIKQFLNGQLYLHNDPVVKELYSLASKRLKSINPDRLSDPEYVNKALLTDLIQIELLLNKAFEAAGKVIESQNQQAQKPYRRKTVKEDLAHDKTSEADNAQDYSAPSEPDTQEVIPSNGPAAMSGDQLKAAGYGLDSSKAANDVIPESGEKPVTKRADKVKQKSPQPMDAENTLVTRVEDPVPLKPPRPSPTNAKVAKGKSPATESPKQYTSEDTLISEPTRKGPKPPWEGIKIVEPSELADDPNHVPFVREHSANQSFDESMLYDFLDRFSEGTEIRKKLDSAANDNGELRDAARTFLGQLGTLKRYVEQYKKTCELLDKDPDNFGKLELARKDLKQAVEKKQQAEEYYRKNFGSENAPKTEEAKSVPISLRKPAPSEPISLRNPKSVPESADVERYGIEPLESEPRLLHDLHVPEGTQAKDFLEKSLRTIISENEWDAIDLLFLADTPDARAHVQAIRAEVASKAEASGGYKSIRELDPIIRRALANRGIKLEDIYKRGLEACVSGQIDEVTLQSAIRSIAILGSLSNQFLPDDVPVYRSVSADAVRLEPDGTYSMASNRHGMSFWGIGIEGREVAEQYARTAHDHKIIFVKTTVGDLRQQGVFTNDLKARTGNALDFYHAHRGNSGTQKWSRIPVEVVTDTKADQGQPISDKASMPDSAPISAATREVKPEAMEPLSGEEPTGVRQVNAEAVKFSPEVAKDDYEWILNRQDVLTKFLDSSKDSDIPGAKEVRQPYDEAAKLLGELSSSTDMADPASWDAEVGNKLNKIKELYSEASKAVSQHMVRIIDCDRIISGDLGRYQGQDKVEPFFGDSKSKQEAAEFNDALKALRAKVENYRKLYDKMSKDSENAALRKQVAEKQQDILEDIITLENSPYYKMEEVFDNEHKKLSDKLKPLSTALSGALVESPFLARGKREVRFDIRTIPVNKLARYYTPEGFKEIPLEKAVKVGVDVSSPEQIAELETRMKGQGIKVIGRSEVKDINTGRLVGNRLTVKLPTGDTLVVNVHVDPAELGEVAAFLGRYEGQREDVLDAFAAEMFSGNQQANQEAMAFRLELNALRNQFLAYEQYRRALRRNPNSSKSEEWEQEASKMLEGANRRMRELERSKYLRMESGFIKSYEAWRKGLKSDVTEVIAASHNGKFRINMAYPEALVTYFDGKVLKGLPSEGLVSVEVEVSSEAEAQALKSKLKVNQADFVELKGGIKVKVIFEGNEVRRARDAG